MTLNTFKEVEAKYNNTKPVNGSVIKKEYDIRPIGKRSKPEDRICKINDNCYALTLWSGISDAPLYKGMQVSSKDLVALSAPIVWRRHANGSETVTIHNSRFSYSTSWIKFLSEQLPEGLSFSIRPRHTVHVVGGLDFYLPKNKIVAVMDKGSRRGSDASFEKALTFRRHWANGKTYRWSLVGDNYNAGLTTKSGYQIDKEMKAPFKDDIKSFREWALAIIPMLTVPDTWDEYRDLILANVRTVKNECDAAGLAMGMVPRTEDWWKRVPKVIWQTAIRDEDNPARLPMVYGFISHLNRGSYGHRGDAFDKFSKEKVMADMNSYINEACGFRKKAE